MRATLPTKNSAHSHADVVLPEIEMGASQSTITNSNPKMEAIATPPTTTTQPSATKMSTDLTEEERAAVGKQEVLRLRGGGMG